MQTETKGLRGRAYEVWLKEKRKMRAQIRAAYRRDRSLAIVADAFKMTRGRVCQIVNSTD